MRSNPSISLCMIVKNEERDLSECLRSVQGFVDEMVVVDTGSNDQTVAIAESFGARVFDFPWGDDFSSARNESLRHARGDWIVCLDADERLDPMGDRDCLRKAASAPEIAAYVVPIRNLKGGHAGCATSNLSSSIRMFANSAAIRFEGSIHEGVDGSLERMGANVGRAGFMIVHEGYDADLSTLYGKLQRNVAILQKRIEQNPDNAFDLYYLGLSLAALGKAGESIEAFQQALSGTGLSPILHAMVLNQLASHHFSSQDYTQTIELAQKSLSLTSCQYSAPYLLGMAHYHRQEPSTALPFLFEARRLLELRSGGQLGDLGHEVAADEAELAKAIEECRVFAVPDKNASLPDGEDFSSSAASPPQLSVCMIVKNEAHQLEEALTHFQTFADEIVVVDTGSTDATKKVANRFTPHVFDFSWVDDFSAARNFSIACAHGRYILWLDADDRFEPEMRERVNRLKDYFDGKKAFYFLLENLNRDDGFSSCCYQLRCVPKSEELRFSGRIHEQILPAALRVGLDLVQTDITVQHQGYMDRGLYLEKMRRNLHLLQIERAEGRDHGTLHFYLALTQAGLGNIADALSAMEAAMERIQCRGLDSWLLIEGYLFLATHYLETGKRDAALRSVVRAEAYAVDEPRNYYRIGLLYQDLNRHHQAVVCFRKAFAGQSSPGFYPLGPPPDSAEIMLYIGYSFLCLGQNEAALEMIREAQNMGMGVGRSWQQVAGRALATNRLDLAFQAYRKAQARGELDADGYCNLGLLFRKRSFPKEAIACYEAALKREPEHRDSLANLAHLYLTRGDTSRAKGMFETLVAAGVRDPDLLLGLAQSALKTGDWERFKSVQNQILQDSSLKSLTERAGKAPASPREAMLLFGSIASVFESQGRKAVARMAQSIVRLLAAEKFKDCSWMTR